VERQNKRFSTRAFVALVMTASGVGLPLTGYMNHVYGFEPISVARHAWMTAHNVLGLLFAVSAGWHAWLNRRALLNHLRGGLAGVRRVGREAACAVAVVGLLVALFVSHAFHAGGGQ
jgi:hypothetical protein